MQPKQTERTIGKGDEAVGGGRPPANTSYTGSITANAQRMTYKPSNRTIVFIIQSVNIAVPPKQVYIGACIIGDRQVIRRTR